MVLDLEGKSTDANVKLEIKSLDGNENDDNNNNDDNTPNPVISDLEISTEEDDSNSHIEHIGQKLNIKANISAKQKIRSITLEIYSEENKEQNWKYLKPIQNAEGLNNTSRHTYRDPT